MKDLSELMNDLRDAINQALWRSGRFADAAAALQEALGDFRISIDVLLPEEAKSDSNRALSANEPTESDLDFLRSLRVKI